MISLFRVAAVAGLLAYPQIALADSPPTGGKGGALYDVIAAQDKAAFDAFNHCDLKTLGSFFVDDVEFYHDRDGLSVGKQPFLDAVRNNVCGKFTRELVPGSLEVYPLPGYGALEIGVHRFVHSDPANPTGQGRFTHIWKNTNGHWQLTRVMSYDHGQAPN